MCTKRNTCVTKIQSYVTTIRKKTTHMCDNGAMICDNHSWEMTHMCDNHDKHMRQSYGQSCSHIVQSYVTTICKKTPHMCDISTIICVKHTQKRDTYAWIRKSHMCDTEICVCLSTEMRMTNICESTTNICKTDDTYV